MESRPHPEDNAIMGRKNGAGTTCAQRRLARACDLMVLTESPGFIHAGNALTAAAANAFGGRREARYDVLALPCLKYAFKQPAFVDLVVGDVLTALGLNASERLLVVTACCPSRGYVRRLKGDEQLASTRLRIKGADINRPRLAGAIAETMILTCMDYRLHGPGGFASSAGGTLLGPRGFDLMTVPGVAKDLRNGNARTDLVISQLERPVRGGLKRLILLAHTDCGKYGGSQAFSSSETEIAALQGDLAIAARVLGRAYPKLRIETAVMRVSGKICRGIVTT